MDPESEAYDVGKLVANWDAARRRLGAETEDIRLRTEHCHDVLLFGAYDHPWHRSTIELPQPTRFPTLLEMVERRLGIGDDPPTDEDASLWKQIRLDFNARYAGAVPHTR